MLQVFTGDDIRWTSRSICGIPGHIIHPSVQANDVVSGDLPYLVQLGQGEGFGIKQLIRVESIVPLQEPHKLPDHYQVECRPEQISLHRLLQIRAHKQIHILHALVDPLQQFDVLVANLRMQLLKRRYRSQGAKDGQEIDIRRYSMITATQDFEG